MSFFAGHQVNVEISEALVSPSFSPLKALRACRWQLDHELSEMLSVHDDNWAQFIQSSRRRLRVDCELYGASHTAQARIKTAALQGNKLRIKLMLASGTVLEGEMLIERYEEIANDDDLLEVEVHLISTGSITITG
jgi:hypothetical protein